MIRPVASNDYKPVVFVRNNSFKGKNVSNLTENYALRDAFKESMITVKLLIYAPFFNDVASIFGRELVYDYETGKLKGIKRFKKDQLVEIKHFYQGTKKVQEIDEYKDGKLVGMTGFAKDGKTRDWALEYGTDYDVTTVYYPDGERIKTIQTELNDRSGRVQIKHFDEKLRWYKTENYKNDVKQEETLLYDDRKEIISYNESGKMQTKQVEFVKGSVRKVVIEYDKYEEPLKTTQYSTKGNGNYSVCYISGVAEYPDKNTKIYTKYDESGNVIYVENTDRRTSKTRRTYNNKK